MSLSLPVRAIALLFLCAVLALPAAAVDYDFTVDVGTDEPDDVLDGLCETAAGQCSLRAAIQEARNVVPDTLHKISFSVTKVTLTSALPDIIQPTVIDGGDGETRVEIDGAGFGCFDANSAEGDSSSNPNLLIPEANNSRFENLVIYGCSGPAIQLSGHGFAVYNNFIGTDATGNAVAANANANSGIVFSAALEDGAIPNNPLPLPDELTDIASIVLFLAGAAPNLPPTGIIQNVISGNALHGVEIHGQYTSTAIVFDNKIGVGADGITQIANGTAGSAPEHGVYVYAEAYLNFIGVNNVIAGNDLDAGSAGVLIDTGKVPFPNFVAGNDIGASKNNAYALDLGNGGIGIQVGDVRPTTAADPIDNPTDLGAVIGPGNIVGYNGDGTCTPTDLTCEQGGIFVTNSNSDGVRIWGNLVGINDPSSFIDIGNHGDGINVVGTNIEIGGSTLPEGNLIGSNDRHGLVIRGNTSTNRVTAHANYIGVTPFDSAVANAGHGIWLNASGTQIGGPAYANERNVIANNAGHAIRFDGGGDAFGNLIQQNEIYNVAPGFLPIDLDNPAGAPDATDNSTVVDRGASAINSYTNWQQNSVTLTSTSGTGTAWELRSALNENYRIDFYSAPDQGDAKTWLCEVAATTSTPDGDGGGMASGTAACAAGGPGLWVTATVTDISPTDGVGETDRPGFPADDPVMNTSEFAAAVQAADQVTLSSATYSGAENGGSILVTLQRVGTGNAAGVSVDVADLLTGTATAGGVDYSFATPTTVSWIGTDGVDKTVSITLVDDALLEGSETVNLQLQNPNGAELGSITSATVTIDDDGDAAPSFAIDDAAGTEVSSPQITFTVTKTGATGVTATVDYDVFANTATAADYSGTLSGTLTFLPNEATKTIVIDITDDAIFEGQEQFTVVLSNATNASITDPNGIGSIDDDDTPTITIDDVALMEGDAATTPFSFTVTLSNPTSTDITVDFATSLGTATVPDDYASFNGTVTFLAGGPLTQAIIVTVSADTTPEPDETFFVDLSNASAGTITDAQGLGTIQNDDAAPTEISITDAMATEGTDISIVFNLGRAGDASAASSVDYTVTPGSAAAPGDYVANDPLTGTVNFAIGDETASITLDLVADAINEGIETFTIELSNPVNALIVDPSGTGTITDDDAVAISINDVTQLEGTGGTTAFQFTVSLSIPSEQTIQVGFATGDGTATTVDADYADSAGTLTFDPLDVSETVNITVVADAAIEPDETFTVNLSNASVGSIADAQGLGTILNDDLATSVAVDDPIATEGTDPSIVFTVTRSGDTSQAATVDFAVAPGTATTPADYTGTFVGTLTFPIGVTTQPITLAVTNDLTFEASESLGVTLSNPTVVTISDATGTGTINDDDSQPTISIDSVSQSEGNAGTSNFTFTVTLSNPSYQGISVDFATANGTADATDYATNGGTLNFAPGVTSQTVDVVVNGDLTIEGDDTFLVNLTNPVNATILTAQGTGTIENDDFASPTFTVDEVTQAEGNAGTSNFSFTVTLAPASDVETTVDVATADGSAVAGVDYTANTQTLTFPAFTATQTFTVSVNGDTTFEGNETFTVLLSNATGGALTSGSGLGTITNDDSQPAISVNDVSQLEGDAGFANMTFAVTLSNPSSQSITVDWLTVDGTASTLAADYADDGGTLTFAPGEVTKDAVVVIVGDTNVEADETFTVQLDNATNATIADPSGTGTILDDDATTSLSIDDPAATEGTPTITFTVTRSGDTSGASSVDYAVNAGSATTPEDYTASAINLRTPAVQTDGSRRDRVAGLSALSGTLTFAAGESVKSITLDIVDDTTFEQPETFTVTLSNPVGATITDGSAIATLADDDPQPSISIANVSQSEGDAGVTTYTFSVTLSNPSSLPITVDYATADGTATVAGLDYTAANGTLTFAPGVVVQTFAVSVDGDTTEEPTETFVVNLTNATNATIADDQATGTIVDDDGASAGVAAVPALGPKELALLAALLAAVGLMVMRKM